jgi:hypothetical protein
LWWCLFAVVKIVEKLLLMMRCSSGWWLIVELCGDGTTGKLNIFIFPSVDTDQVCEVRTSADHGVYRQQSLHGG